MQNLEIRNIFGDSLSLIGRDVHLRKAKFYMAKEYCDFLPGIGASLGPKNKYLEIFCKFRIWTDVLKVFNL